MSLQEGGWAPGGWGMCFTHWGLFGTLLGSVTVGLLGGPPGPMCGGERGPPQRPALGFVTLLSSLCSLPTPPRRSLAGKGGVICGLRRRFLESPLLGRTMAPGTQPRDLPPPGHAEGSDPVPVLRECPPHTRRHMHLRAGIVENSYVEAVSSSASECSCIWR